MWETHTHTHDSISNATYTTGSSKPVICFLSFLTFQRASNLGVPSYTGILASAIPNPINQSCKQVFRVDYGILRGCGQVVNYRSNFEMIVLSKDVSVCAGSGTAKVPVLLWGLCLFSSS